tara:strand:- start:35 stop:196 length:162 start_codon:yes stop_codon:yes gene_type:complete
MSCKKIKSKDVKVQDLLYKNELDVIYQRVVKVGLGGKIIEYLKSKKRTNHSLL